MPGFGPTSPVHPRRRRRRLALCACITVLALVAAACGSDDDSSGGSSGGGGGGGGGGSEATVKIGIAEALSGDLNAIGIPFAAGVELAVQEINDAGGFTVGDTTYTFDLVSVDNRSTGPGTVAAMNELIEDEGADFIFGPMATSIALQAAEISVEAGVMHLSGAGGWQTNGYFADPERPYLFGTFQRQSATAETLGLGMAEQGYESVALINGDDATTDANLASVIEGLEAAGIEVVADVRYPLDSTDLTSFVTRAGSEGADVILHSTPPARSLEVLQLVESLDQAEAIGAWVLSPNAMADAGLTLPTFTANSGPSMDFPSNDRIAAMAERMAELKPDLGITKDFAFWTYDFVYMLAAAMEDAGSVDDLDAISESLLSMRYDGVVGSICFGDGEDVRLAVYPSFLATSRDGEVEVTSRDRDCDSGEQTLEVAHRGPEA